MCLAKLASNHHFASDLIRLRSGAIIFLTMTFLSGLCPIRAQEPADVDTVVVIEREIIFVENEYIPPFAAIDGVLYFACNDGTEGVELWRSDGTELGTRMVKDINPWGNSNPRYLTVVNGVLFFQADDGVSGVELWKSDGTEQGTVLVRDIYPARSSYPSHLICVGDLLYFQADDGISGIELWRSNGTSSGTNRVDDINPIHNDAFPKTPHSREWVVR